MHVIPAHSVDFFRKFLPDEELYVPAADVQEAIKSERRKCYVRGFVEGCLFFGFLLVTITSAFVLAGKLS